MKKKGRFRKLRRIVKRLKFRTVDLFLFLSNEKLADLMLPAQYSLKIFNTNEKTGIKRIDRRKNDRNLCYAIFDNDKLIHTSWVFKKKSLARQLGYKDAYTIGPCETDEEYRGKGIYPAVLNAIRKNFGETRFIIFAKVSNAPSIRGITKAGFEKILKFKMVKIFGFKFAVKYRSAEN